MAKSSSSEDWFSDRSQKSDDEDNSNLFSGFAHQITEGRKKKVELSSDEDNWYLPWNDYFISLCYLTAARSKDPNTKVGSCIVDKDNNIISVGYNGMPRGIKDEKLPWEKTAKHIYDTKYPYVCHAEMNAIMNGRKCDLENCCLYVTKFPCPECAKLIIQSGIKHVVYTEKAPEPLEVRVPSQKMFNYAGVTCRKFIPTVKSFTLNVFNGQGNVFINK